jgi:hypothetical protein
VVPTVVPTVMRRGADSGATVPPDARNTQDERERERERHRGTVAPEDARQQREKCAHMFFAALAQERRFLVDGRRHRRLDECGESAPTTRIVHLEMQNPNMNLTVDGSGISKSLVPPGLMKILDHQQQRPFFKPRV